MRTPMRILSLALIALVLSVPASAQVVSDACQAATPPFVVTSGRPPTITWVVPATVLDATTSTAVPYIVDGFSYQMDAGTRVEILPKPTAGAVCAAGTANAGNVPYLYVLPSGVTRGSHILTLYLWYFDRTIDPATGNVIVGTTKKEAFVVVPFVAADGLYTGPPLPPKGVKIWR